MTNLVLLHSPLVGPASLAPTYAALERGGMHCLLPSPRGDATQSLSWHDWPTRLLDQLPALDRPVFVGHSMAGLLAARLAAGFDRSSVICLDANMPPESGPTRPVDPEFRRFLDTLPVSDGRLPPWHRWWPNDVFAGVSVGEEMRARVEDETPSLALDWFDDAFAMPDWSHARRAFIRLDAWFDDEADRAEDRGWPVIRVDGTHLHPASRPEETAAAILRACEALDERRA